MVDSSPTLITDDSLPILDDCWKRIGVYGDKSCPRLVEHVHCRNCEVYAQAAISLLDRYGSQLLERDDATADVEQDLGECRSTLIFRLGEQWLGLATSGLVSVVSQTTIHSLPHQRSRSVLGVTNVNGALVACISLQDLLGLEPVQIANTERRVVPRMLILGSSNGVFVAPVDEVEGIHRIALSAIREPARGVGQAAGQYAKGVVRWRERSITLLDEQLLAQAMTRSLA
ncbi:chemotaxis protein CheW [Pseudomonas segetis]|uniref:Chemotaxis protein CheW n=1 Tax=Pseudomonas segetis TaxID=298908 RepID=A0A238ZJ43_9PSED|nr:chemotaxis protein CheW [Pseudomonas segetis]SNR83486.1 chemotaxis-related protein WspD [Pseudomonas segetis]